MWIYDLDSLAFVRVNEAAVRAYGYSREEFLSMTVLDIQPEEERERFRDASDAARITHQRSGNWRHRLRDGAIRDVEVDANVLEMDGRMVALTVVHDVTERVRAEAALRDSEARFRDLFENTNDIIYTHDLSGRLLTVSPAAERMSGYRPEELVGRPIESVVAPEHLERARAAMQRKVGGEAASTTYEIDLVGKDGRRIPVEVSTRLVLRDNEPVAIEGVARDVTDRRRAQEGIRTAAERAEALAIVSRSIAEARLDLDVILDTVCKLASSLIGDACVIRLLREEDDDFLDTVAIHHPRREIAELIRRLSSLHPQRADEGLFARVVQERTTVSIEDVTSQDIPDRLRPHYEEYVAQAGIRSVLSAPMVVQGSVIGSITLTRDRGGDGYDRDDSRFLAELADRTAIAVANARLFELTRDRLRQVQALRRIDTSIIGTLDVGMTLDVIVEQIRSELRVDAASILLLEPSARTLAFAAGSGFRTDIRDMTLRLGEGNLGPVVLDREMVIETELVRSREFSRRGLARREGFDSHVAVPLVARTEVKGVLEVFGRRQLTPRAEWLDFLRAMATQAAIAIDNAQLVEELQRANLEQSLAYETTLEGWSRALDLRDHETEGHSVRVAQMTLRLARAIGMSGEQLVNIRRGALLHDIGKMGIPDEVLLKEGSLDEDEWRIMRRHPEYARDLLMPIRFLRPALEVPYSHHERWDGSGYPQGLAGEEIPLAARVFAVVDVWDALLSDRPYRPALSKDEVRAYLQGHAGTLFDPDVVTTFLEMEW